MDGSAFFDALRDAIAPVTVTKMRGDDKGIDVVLSDGQAVNIRRRDVKALEPDDLRSFLARLGLTNG